MPWIDITRNIDTGQDERVVDLFTLLDADLVSTLYAIAKVGNSNTPTVYKVYMHLGADSPVVDTIWSESGYLPPLASGETYVPGGKIEETGGYIYLGNNRTGEIYTNATPYVIDGDWDIIVGPYGAKEFTGVDANLKALYIFNQELYAAHRGGVSVFNKDTKAWTLVGRFVLAGSYGTATDLYGFKGELYATVSYDNVGILYKYNSTVESIDKWLKVSELPRETLQPTRIVEYKNRLYVFATDPDKNVFDTDNVGTEFTGEPVFNYGEPLRGVPTSVVNYRKDDALWVTCTKEEYPRLGYIVGDVNGDGKVDWDDYTDLLVAWMTNDFSSLYNPAAADVNRNGLIDIADLIALGQYINGHFTIPDEVYTDTTGTNLITNIGVNSEISDVTSYLEYSNFVFLEGLSTPRMVPISSSNLQTIEYPRQETTEQNLGRRSVFVTNPLTDLTQIFTFTCHLNVDDPFVIWSQTSQDWSPEFTVSVGIANPDWTPTSPAGTPEFIEAPQIESVVTTTVPQFVRMFGHINDPLIYRARVNVKYVFDARKLASVNGDIRIKFTIDLTRDGRGAHHSQTHLYYRPILKIQNIKLDASLSGIHPDVTYVAKSFDEIPEEFKVYHKVSAPSGPDQWFVQFSDITDNIGSYIYPVSIPEYFHGAVLRRLVSNSFDLAPGGQYQCNFTVFIPPYADQKSFDVSAYIPQLSDRRFILNYNASGISLNRFNQYTTTFNVPVDAPVSGITQTRLYLNVIETIPESKARLDLTVPAVYISDVNIVPVLYGPTENVIYRYTGNTWEYTSASIVDPAPMRNIPRSGLIDNFDIQSNEYQLYSVGGGKVWVHAYPGNLYSGSALGIEYDRRPQIVNIL